MLWFRLTKLIKSIEIMYLINFDDAKVFFEYYLTKGYKGLSIESAFIIEGVLSNE